MTYQKRFCELNILRGIIRIFANGKARRPYREIKKSNKISDCSTVRLTHKN